MSAEEPMTYDEALKKVQANLVADNYFLVKLSYGKHLILPYKDGITVLGALGKAEILEEDYPKPKRIKPLGPDILEVSIMSRMDYEDYKVAALLDIKVEEVRKFRELAGKPKETS